MKIIKPLTFDPFTFSRASEATYYNSSGLIEVAANDVLRIGYDPSTLENIGPVLEAEGVNLLAESSDFLGDSWEFAGLDGSVAPAITDSPAVASSPYPGYFTGDNDVSSHTLRQTALEDVTGNAVFSVYVKSAAPSTETVRLSLQSMPGGGITSVVFRILPGDFASLGSDGRITKLPNGWFRCEVRRTTSGPVQASIILHGTGTKHLYIWGAQVEADPVGGWASSYISNASDTLTATRAADIVTSQTPSLIESNIEENDAPVWDPGDSYVEGDQVMVLGQYHRVYEALAGSTDSFPPENVSGLSPNWLDIGATNRWRMFDMNVGSDKQSTANNSSGDIDVTMGVESFVSSVVLLNASGVTATIIMRNSINEIIYEREVDLLGTPMGVGWWEFYFGYRSGVRTIIFTDLPLSAPATIQVIIDGGSGIAGLGKLILGNDIEIGCTRFGTSVGIVDFSRKERDEFGNYYILERRFIDKCDYDIQIDSDKVDDVKDLLTELRAKLAVYVGSEKYKSTIVYGYYRDFSIVIQGSKKSQCVLSVEGL